MSRTATLRKATGLLTKLANDLGRQPTTDERQAVWAVAKAPAKAAARREQVAQLLDDTDEGDLGWETELAALDTALGIDVRCRCCGIRLTDPESVRLGIGPICRQETT